MTLSACANLGIFPRSLGLVTQTQAGSKEREELSKLHLAARKHDHNMHVKFSAQIVLFFR